MDGIIVASDQTLEWALPWWLDQYQRHNSCPVAFIDLGLSFEKKEWCKQYGQLIPLRIVDFAEEVDPQIGKKWEAEFGKQFWDSRNAWFKKPLACLKSPFQRTIWIDVDCEVRGPVTPLFEYANIPPGLAMAKEQIYVIDSHQMYNSGVIVFSQNHPLIKEWADVCLTQSRNFSGDQEVLSQIIAEKKIQICELPPCYNWSRLRDEQPSTMIQHWHGTYGKYVIKNQVSNMGILR